MIEIGRYHNLRIARGTDNGLYLENKFEEEVLLPNKYCPKEYEIDDQIRVFIYLDHEERLVATTLTPKVHLNEFAFLEVKDASSFGSFLDWGLEKELLLPFREQNQNTKEGQFTVVRLCIDELTDRLYASQRIDKWLQNELLNIAVGDEVDLLIYKKTDLGFTAIINNEHKGLLYFNEIFKPVKVGQSLKGFVKRMREDNKIDLSLQPIGYRKSIDINVEKVKQVLIENSGFLNVNDKSSPEQIAKLFSMSKKSFKKALGSLYKDRMVEISDTGLMLLEVSKPTNSSESE